MQPAVMDILRSSPLCVLCTCKDDIPDASLMLYLCDEEGTKMHMLTLRETNKFKNITANANVSLLVDTRGAGPGGADRAQALTVHGRASIVEDPETAKRLIDRLARRHPYLANLAGNETVQVIEVLITGILFLENVDKAADVPLPGSPASGQ